MDAAAAPRAAHRAARRVLALRRAKSARAGVRHLCGRDRPRGALPGTAGGASSARNWCRTPGPHARSPPSGVRRSSRRGSRPATHRRGPCEARTRLTTVVSRAADAANPLPALDLRLFVRRRLFVRSPSRPRARFYEGFLRGPSIPTPQSFPLIFPMASPKSGARRINDICVPDSEWINPGTYLEVPYPHERTNEHAVTGPHDITSSAERLRRRAAPLDRTRR